MESPSKLRLPPGLPNSDGPTESLTREAFQDLQNGAQAAEVSKPTMDDSVPQSVTNDCFKPPSPNTDVWEK